MHLPLTIDPETVYQKSARPHEPIEFGSEEERAAFAETVWQYSAKLFDALSAMGYVGSWDGLDDEEIDFYMNHDAGTFRMLSLLINSWRMVNPGLVPAVAGFLRGLDAPYSAFVTCDIDVSTELFMIFVTPDEAVAAIETKKTASALGFDPDSGAIGPIT